MDEEVKNARAKLAERFANSNAQIGGKGNLILTLVNYCYRNPKEKEEARCHPKCQRRQKAHLSHQEVRYGD